MQDEWRRRFLDDGEVEVRVARRIGGFGMLAVALGFGIPSVYFLVTPRAVSFYGLGGLRLAGVLGLVLAVPALLYALRMLLKPVVLLRLDRDGLRTTHAPLAYWHEVEGARTWRTGSLTLASIALAPSFWERVEHEDPQRARRLRMHAVGGGDRVGHVVVPSGAPGGGDALVALILWAKHEVQQPR
jgi:hypothetical protein